MDTGLPMTGGFLRPLPPNASREDQVAAINEILAKLNSWNGVIVRQDTTNITVTGPARETFTVPHNLGYAPVPQAFLNAVDLTPLEDVNIPLPAWLSIGSSGGNVVFPIWVSIYTDDTNLYIDVFNATGLAIGTFPVTYYLLRINAQK